MPLILRQIQQLVYKNYLIAAVRRPISTLLRSFIFPLVLILIVTYAEVFLNPPQQFGIGSAEPIKSLSDAFAAGSPTKDRIAFIYPDNPHEEITNVTNTVAAQVVTAKRKVVNGADEGALTDLCQSSHRGTTNCFGAIVINSSPNFPRKGGSWNYTMRYDESLGSSFDVKRQNNDAQIYVLPLQLAMDQAIARRQGKDIPTVNQYPFTKQTEAKREADTHQSYIGSGIAFFGVVFFLGMVGVVYQATGLLAYEREAGLSQLIESMMPNRWRRMPGIIRLISHHIAFSLIYLPGWIAVGVILGVKVFTFSSTFVVLVYHILCGLSLVSWSMFAAAFFKRAQLSGIAVTVVTVVTAIIPQVLNDKQNNLVTVIALGIFFPSSNYTYMISYISRWEYQSKAADFHHRAPKSPWKLAGANLFYMLILQLFAYAFLAICIENMLFSTASRRRRLTGRDPSRATVTLNEFGKTYKPNIFSRLFTKNGKPVRAVQSLSLQAYKGQICMLLGPNGSGKSTTLDAIAGFSRPTQGQIELDGSGGLGVTPQRNILWDDLTVSEHAKLFFNLKTAGRRATRQEVSDLLCACDIDLKARAKVKTLSGGQKRKVQLAMMFAGNSAVCCVDEVSSGLDPLSRRKIWDILLEQRASRTIIMTTHFLDEADALSDHIAILSKGALKAEGSSAELKQHYGKGYTIDVQGSNGYTRQGEKIRRRTIPANDPNHVSAIVGSLEREGISEFAVNGPTLEDVFLQLAGTSMATSPSQLRKEDNHVSRRNTIPRKSLPGVAVEVSEVADFTLNDGSHISGLHQAWILFNKRLMVFKSKWGPYLSALIVALIGAGVSPLFIKYFRGMQCALPPPGTDPYSTPVSGYPTSLTPYFASQMIGGPPSKDYDSLLQSIVKLYPSDFSSIPGTDPPLFSGSLTNVTTLQSLNDQVAQRHADLMLGAFWLGDASSAPTIAWNAYLMEIYNPMMLQNIISNVVGELSIVTSYSALNIPPEPSRYDFGALLFTIYFCLIFCLYPAFYALYPTIERLRQARALQHSNGVRSRPMWAAYLIFDFLHIVVISAIAAGLLSNGSRFWYHLPYLFIVMLFYGIASTILGYLISLFAKSQLAAWAFCASGQVVVCLAYFGAYLGLSSSTNVSDLHTTLLKVQYSIGIVSPIANLQRSVFIALNQFLLQCGENDNPGAGNMYGGPIGYLVMQCIVMMTILLVWDSGIARGRFTRSRGTSRGHRQEIGESSPTQAYELQKIDKCETGLRVKNLSKTFGDVVAVDDVTFSIDRSEIFALLGPNGAGKSTAISLIRGDLKPSDPESSIFVDQFSLQQHRAKARAQLGVCPQFDAADVLSVRDHLLFYARIRGVTNPTHNVEQLISVFGLETYRNQLASKLSGGTKRKLSLAISLIGNPSVLLLDEPSTGLDAASKRTMWRTLASVAKGRSVLLTTHSMEEADALADRAAIMSSRILALDTCVQLRQRWGDALNIHIVLRSAPHTSDDEIHYVKQWLRDTLTTAMIDERTYCGQIRLTIPPMADGSAPVSVGQVFRILEGSKDGLGIAYYSVGRTTLDQVFVNVVREHGGIEEGAGHTGMRRRFCGLLR